MPLVPRTHTGWTTRELLGAYARAWRRIHPDRPPLSRGALAVLWAHACIEVGRRGASCWNNNPGNIRAIQRPIVVPVVLLPGAYEFAPSAAAVPRGARIIDPPAGSAPPPGSVCYLPAEADQTFRAFDTLEDGCAAKLELLRDRYPGADAALAAASGAAAARPYVADLARGGYFKADPVVYSAGVLSLAAECLRETPADAWPLEPLEPLELEPDAPTLPDRPVPLEVPQAIDVVRTLADEDPPTA